MTPEILDRFKDFEYGFIIIAGPTCSGKTTLSHELESFFENKKTSVTIIKEDDYFKDLKDMPRSPYGYMTDGIDAFHAKELKEDVEKYIKYGNAEMPIYDIASNSRLVSKRYITLSKVTIIEGLHTISLFHKFHSSICIYIDTPIDVCLKRRIDRDKNQFGVPEERIVEHFNDCIMPSYKKDILPQKFLDGVILFNNE